MTNAYTDILYLSMEDVEKVSLSFIECINIIEETFLAHGTGSVELPLKQEIKPSHNSFLHAMSARVPSMDGLGMKYISYLPANFENGLPDSTAVLVLNDPVTLHPICIMEGLWLTYLRTGCMAAVAAKYCAREKTEVVSFIGLGGLARWTLPALEVVLPNLKKAKGFARRQSSKDNFIIDMKERVKTEITVVQSAQEAIQGSDLIISATSRPPEPFLEEEWWSPGSVAIPLDTLSCWKPTALERADKFICTDPNFIRRAIKLKYPDFNFRAEPLEVGKIISGGFKGRESDEERIMVMMSGVGSIDVTIGKKIYDLAVEKGIGTKLNFMRKDIPLPSISQNGRIQCLSRGQS